MFQLKQSYTSTTFFQVQLKRPAVGVPIAQTA